MKSLHLLSVILLSVVFTAQDSAGQGKKDKKSDKTVPGPITITVNIDVFDEQGNPLQSVDKADVKILEDGIVQDVADFRKVYPISRFGVLIDNSGSMKNLLGKMTKIREAAAAELLSNDDELFIVRFVSSEIIEVVLDWTSEKRKVVGGLDDLYAEGGQSAVLDAIYLGDQKLDERRNKGAGTALILISDAEERRSYYDLDETIRNLRKTDTPLFLVSFAENVPLQEEKAKSLAAQLTLETGGSIFLMKEKFDPNEFLNALKKIKEEMKFRYRASYMSKNQLRDGKLRQLSIQVADSPDGKKRTGRIRDSFIVPKQ